MNTALNALDGNRLTLTYLLEHLQHDGIISSQQIAQLHSHLQKDEEEMTHPLIIISDQGWQSISKPPFPLSNLGRHETALL